MVTEGFEIRIQAEEPNRYVSIAYKELFEVLNVVFAEACNLAFAPNPLILRG